jgi:hypothetical protein
MVVWIKNMTDLDDAIDSSKQEIKVREAKAPGNRKPDQKKRWNLKIPILVLAAVVVALQWNTLNLWIFGLPEETVQADIVSLLKNSDQKVQDIYSATGELPGELPAEMPSWLLGYKKTLAGYKINTEVDGVVVELEREGNKVLIDRK